MKSRFIVIEGPNGAGKSDVCTALAANWQKRGRRVEVISEPSESRIGNLVCIYREMEAHPLTLACLTAADRYSNIVEHVRPARRDGTDVICSRYVPSHFVYQVMHGVPRSFLRNLNSLVEPPDLTILLEVDYDVLVKRIKKRKSSKFSENVASLKREVDLYRRVGRALKQVGHKFVVIRNEVGHFDETVEQIDRLCDAL